MYIQLICYCVLLLVDTSSLFGYHKINKRKEVQTNEEVRFHIHIKEVSKKILPEDNPMY